MSVSPVFFLRHEQKRVNVLHLNRQALLEVAIGYCGDLEGKSKVHSASQETVKTRYTNMMPFLRKASFGDEK